MRLFIPLAVSALLLILGCTQEGTQIANPASTYCIEQGGTLDIRSFTDGDKGFCIFEDGTECEEWSYYQGECEPSSCKDLCGDEECQEIVCMGIGCPCAETVETCPIDCA